MPIRAGTTADDDPITRRPASRAALTADPTHSTEPIPSTLTSTRTKQPPDNVDIGQRRYKARHGRDHPDTAKVQRPTTTLTVVNVDAVGRPAAPSVRGRQGDRDLREIVNAILYQNRTGSHWAFSYRSTLVRLLCSD